ncbi:MAG: NifB/NifX family molybdenum-iron cluster-binding protein [Planctomycetota bacterium]|nr:NifB/NifX family molybdenum-iron cluster-binding protein [Planctomycetota bacterium]
MNPGPQHPDPSDSQPRLGIWRLSLPAAPRPLLLRRDRPFDAEAPVVDVPDVMRYVASARTSLHGPLVLEIEGPGDPLASPESVLRILALIREHPPDVLTGLVIDGPLLGEYTDELEQFGLGYLVLRLDAATPRAAERLVAAADFRADTLDRAEAAQLMLDETTRAMAIAQREGIALAARTTLIPTVNGYEIEALANLALKGGAERLDVVPHVVVPGAPLSRGVSPTALELEDARAIVDRVFPGRSYGSDRRVTDWIHPQRSQLVDLDRLDAVDVLRTLPDPEEGREPAQLLPRREPQLIALASRDGTLVDTPLAAARQLRIYAVTNNQIRLLGTRSLEENPRRRYDGIGDARSFLRAVVGCRAVVTTAFSARAVTLMRAVGIRPVAVGGPTEAVLDRVARGTLRQVT